MLLSISSINTALKTGLFSPVKKYAIFHSRSGDRDANIAASCVCVCVCVCVWCGVVWCGVVWCGVVWCGVVWCGVVWCVCDVVVVVVCVCVCVISSLLCPYCQLPEMRRSTVKVITNH